METNKDIYQMDGNTLFRKLQLDAGLLLKSLLVHLNTEQIEKTKTIIADVVEKIKSYGIKIETTVLMVALLDLIASMPLPDKEEEICTTELKKKAE